MFQRCDGHRLVVLPKWWIVEPSVAGRESAASAASRKTSNATNLRCRRSPGHDPYHGLAFHTWLTGSYQLTAI